MLLRAFAVLIALAAVPSAAPAQHAPAGHARSAELPATQQTLLAEFARQTDQLEAGIAESEESDDKLVDIRLALEDIAARLLESSVGFRPRLSEINGRLEQLGSAPAEGQPAEPALVAEERKALLAEKAEINVLIGKAEDLSIRVNDLIDRVSVLRSELFQRQLTARYDLVESLGEEPILETKEELESFYRTVSSWFRFVLQFKLQAALLATLLALAAAVILLVGGRRMFGRLIEPDPDTADPSYLTRVSVAFWSTLLPTMALGVFFVITEFLYAYYNVLREDIGVFLRSLIIVVLIVFCVNRLARAALSPWLPNWRLVPVASQPARWLVWIATAMAVVLGLNMFLSTVTKEMGSPLSITIARSFVATIVVGLLLILIGVLRPFRDDSGPSHPWPIWLRVLFFGIGGFTILAALLGYIGLASFLSMQVVVTGTLLLTAYIGFLSARAIGEEGRFAHTVFGRRMAAGGRFGEATLDQLGLVVSVALNLMIAAIFVPLLLFMWGFQAGDMRGWAYKLATGIQIGSINISLTGILSGIFVFVAGYFLTRWFQGWLDGSVMARGRVDPGLRNSIRTVVGYAGVALAAVIGVSAAGVDLSNLALIAGGLSLGIGFGLQNVVSNFVSGLILLAERPFKVGDWVVAGDVSGTVRKISVRATEIETFQRQTMIVPNSLLINAAVGNWTHRNKLGRLDIKVNLAYGGDVRKAHDAMLAIARAHPMVLKNPEPFVLLANFGPGAVEFEIRVFLADVLASNSVQNDIRMQVVEAFAREQIEMSSTTPRATPAKDDHATPAAVAPAARDKEPKPRKTEKAREP